MTRPYDAIVIGARCAGSPTAMLLARKGYRVLLLDRATFPSDTISTHVAHPLAVAALDRWGLGERLAATGCPPIGTYRFDFGPFTISGFAGTAEASVAYCPRRTVLDKLLIDAAAEAGAEVREGFAVDEVLIERGAVVGIKGRSKTGARVSEHARIVVGADGRHSIVAAAVQPEAYHEKPPFLAIYYTYWSGLPQDSFDTYVRPQRGFAAAPTHDGLTLTVGGWPYAEFDANKRDVEGNFLKMFDLAPAFGERVSRAAREAPFAGAAVPSYFRKPYGPGWALAGDAGYNRDPITAQGIGDAFSDAESLSTAIDRAFGGQSSFDAAMQMHQRERDERVLPMFGLTCQIATLEPPPEELQQVLRSSVGYQPVMDAFVQMNAGTITPAAFGAVAAGSRSAEESVG